jgi:phage-related protein
MLSVDPKSGKGGAAVLMANGCGSAGVLEVVEDDSGGTYRAVYTAKFDVAPAMFSPISA